MIAFLDWGLTISLLQTKPFPELPKKLVNLLQVRKGLGDSLFLHTPLSPCNNLGVLCLNFETPYGLNRIEPGVEGDKSKVHIPKFFAPQSKVCHQVPPPISYRFQGIPYLLPLAPLLLWSIPSLILDKPMYIFHSNSVNTFHRLYYRMNNNSKFNNEFQITYTRLDEYFFKSLQGGRPI